VRLLPSFWFRIESGLPDCSPKEASVQTKMWMFTPQQALPTKDDFAKTVPIEEQGWCGIDHQI
jgi:hypothetical protein